MRARLFSRSGTFNGQSFEIEGETTIGRNDRNRIVLKSRTVSSEHARIFPDDEGVAFLLEDLGSLNGTCIDGIRVVGAEPLGALNVITFAENADFVFQLSDAAAEASGKTLNEEAAPQWPEKAIEESEVGEERVTIVEEGPIRVPDLQLDAPVIASSSTTSQHLVVVTEEGEIKLEDGEHGVGRGEESAIRLAEHSVSRQHAVLRWLDGRATLQDLGSSNGTFLESVQLEEETNLVLPCKVTFGAVEVVLRLDVE